MKIVKNRYRGTREYSLVHHELTTAAKYRGTVTYQEIAKVKGLPPKGSFMGKEIGHLLGEISEDEVQNNRPMLSAVAVNTKGQPGPGFFKLATDLGKLTKQYGGNQEAFWERERNLAYKTWKVVLFEKALTLDL